MLNSKLAITAKRTLPVPIPTHYLYYKPLIQYITDLIHEYGYDSFNDLADTDKLAIAALMSAAGNTPRGRFDYECITEVDNDTFSQTMDAFRKMLTGTKAEAVEFAEVLKANAVEYFEQSMSRLFYRCLGDYNNGRREWLDFMSKETDPDEAYDLYRNGL